ncbi:ABC transporter permease [Bacillus salitolerans]|uniref:ABC transporter permease n=1 Tax=Bacillus salitolerans TaxID=1437434 RepID=A0ABW4LV05_9BACI
MVGGNQSFWVMVKKELRDQVMSWRFLIIIILLLLTCMASLYTALSNIRDAAQSIDADDAFLFLKMFTISDPDSSLPPFITFISFLGPLLGIGLGFDAINSERNNRTLPRVLAQPIPRDYLINAKFTASLLLIGGMLLSLGLIVTALAILSIGLLPSWEEFWRIIVYILSSVVYVAFWLNLAILCSVRFRQAATSALASLGVWLFFSIFFAMIISMIGGATAPKTETATMEEAVSSQELITNLSRVNPSYLFSEVTTILLTPEIRTLGPLSMEQVVGAIPSPLPLAESLLLIWPQCLALLAGTLICFAISYIIFMRQEIRT